jgi:hypothetical protein
MAPLGKRDARLRGVCLRRPVRRHAREFDLGLAALDRRLHETVIAAGQRRVRRRRARATGRARAAVLALGQRAGSRERRHQAQGDDASMGATRKSRRHERSFKNGN